MTKIISQKPTQLIFALTAGITTIFSCSLSAEEDPLKLADVVVTATKTGEVSLQEVPASITVINEEQMQESGVNNIEDLTQQTPGLSVSRNGQAARIYIRGVGTNLDFIGADPSVTVHVDGVYQSRTTTALDDFLEVERVEVLRGPQGTLYGRNSTGGTINVISKLPEAERKSKVKVELGSDELRRFSASASGGLGNENLMGGIAIMKTDHDPYVDNINPVGIDGLMDEDSLTSKGTLRYLAGAKGEVVLRADYTDIDRATGAYKSTGLDTDGNPALLAAGVNVPSDPFEMDISYANPFLEQTNWGTSAELIWQLSQAWSVTSLTGYRDLDLHTIEDTDGSNLDVLVTDLSEEQDQLSEELRFNYESGQLELVAGLYYLGEGHTSKGIINVNGAGVKNNLNTSNDTTAYAAFGQGTYGVTDKLNATLGLRYSYEEKEFRNDQAITINANGAVASSFIVDEKTDWDAWSPKAALDYTFDNGPMVYGSVSRGFKSGGFNFTSDDAEYDPEFVWSYETGVKQDWFQNTLRTNLVLFYYDYTDLQVSDFTQPGVLSISNAADAEIKGVELETRWMPHYDWMLELNYAFLDATYKDYLAPIGVGIPPVDVSGNNLNAAPEHKVNAAVQYFQNISKGTISYRVEYFWQDKVYFTAFNKDVSSQDAYGLWNARINFRSLDESWELQFYGENLADKDYSTSSREFPAATTGVTRDINPPLTFGAKLTYNFM